MLKDIFKWITRALLQMIMWVFILSISWDGKSLFQRFHNVLVDNEVVATLDSELADLWYQLSETARLTFAHISDREDEKIQ